MARQTRWDRFALSFVGNEARTQHTVQLGTFSPGETITRIRFTYFMSSYNAANPLLNDDVVIALGIDVSESAQAPTPFMPATAPNHDWMWWEGDTQGLQWYGFGEEAKIVQEARGPMYREPRDVKAQRLNDGTNDWSLWLKTQSTIEPGQGLHYLGVAASVLILEAA